MQRICLHFALSDRDIAEIISDSKPPDGVTVGKPTVFIQASASSGGVFTQIVIQILQDVHEVGILVLAAWLYDCCVKSGKKKGRVNKQQIVLNKRNISLLVKRELTNQIAREKQRRNDKNRPAKKRP
jgi:hypothetical protein